MYKDIRLPCNVVVYKIELVVQGYRLPCNVVVYKIELVVQGYVHLRISLVKVYHGGELETC